MTSPQPAEPPFTGGVCASWAQPKELPVDVQGYHPEPTWCAILGLASDVLWGASGRRWRNVAATETVTLDGHRCGCGPRGWPLDQWGPWGMWRWSADTRPTRVRLPRPDVTAITQVTLDGATFGNYRRSGNWAVRTDYTGWPLTNTTLITYQFGRPVPSGGNLAAILLGTELGKALAGKACGLPARVTSVTRQGITFEALESLEVLKEGLTGIHAVDLWLRAVNPEKVAQQAQVWSPDTITARSV